jgi:hypothetical protein
LQNRCGFLTARPITGNFCLQLGTSVTTSLEESAAANIFLIGLHAVEEPKPKPVKIRAVSIIC